VEVVAVRAQENRARHRSAGPTEEPASAQRAAGTDGQPAVKKEPKKEGHEGPADLLRWGFIMVITGALVITISTAVIAIATTHTTFISLSAHKIVIAVHVFNVIVSQYVFAHHNSHFSTANITIFKPFKNANIIHNYSYCQI
jgi:hypothetical protein